MMQDSKSFGLISMGIAALGASATAGLSATDVQRLKMLVSGQGPSVHPAVPLVEVSALEQAAVEAAGQAHHDTSPPEAEEPTTIEQKAADTVEEDAPVPPVGTDAMACDPTSQTAVEGGVQEAEVGTADAKDEMDVEK